ncbi:hypothetical protein [Streptomyces sp. NPDC053560]|uniref:hypothetical protein n=1 Tax=Streptomyces sp. NPDC053560 TaxID=3365711 RepID=UPI0037D631F8
MQELTLDGPLASGVRATLTLHGAPPTPLTITEVTAGTGLATEVGIPDGTLLRFRYRLSPLPEGTRVTHRAEIEGPSADTEGFATSVTGPIPDTLRKLVEVAAARTA